MSTRNFTRPILYSLSILTLSAVLASNIFRSSSSMATGAIPNPATDIPKATVKGEQVAVLAGGCFWGMEAVFEHLNGVSNVVSGFSGDGATTANYPRVSTGQTKHAEAVQITYDPSQITYGQLLKVYFSVAHDPTEVNRQGPDEGPQYRSAIFFANDKQKQVAQAYIKQLDRSKSFNKPIATQLVPLDKFYAAENYHQNFITRNPKYPYVVIHDLPKIKQLQKLFPTIYKN
jgi:peptide-methionine (S)-S-oxide reductase